MDFTEVQRVAWVIRLLHRRANRTDITSPNLCVPTPKSQPDDRLVASFLHPSTTNIRLSERNANSL